MAWNDPPSFDYQQLSNSGRKFKHRYVLDSKLGHNQSNQFQQAPTSRDPIVDHQQQSSLYPNQSSNLSRAAAPTDYQQQNAVNQTVNQYNNQFNGGPAQIQQFNGNMGAVYDGTNNNIDYNSIGNNSNGTDMNPVAYPLSQAQQSLPAHYAMEQQEKH